MTHLSGQRESQGRLTKPLTLRSIFQRFGNHEHDKSVRLFRIQSKATRKRKPKSPDGKIYQDAAMEVKKIHFDYNDLSKLERKTMGRIIPFYEYNRMVLPAMLKGFAQRPDRLTKRHTH